MDGFTLWFTGLSGSGKTTLSTIIYNILKDKNLKIELLDGDEIRNNLSKGLTFSKKDRDINVRRIGYVCHLLSRNDIIAISAAISPYEAIRNENRKLIGRYVETYCKCSLEVLKQRDPKKLYERALRGEIKNFTGISDPYEAPTNAEIICNTDIETPTESVFKILRTLEILGYIPSDTTSKFSSSNRDDLIRSRLEGLGYF